LEALLGDAETRHKFLRSQKFTVGLQERDFSILPGEGSDGGGVEAPPGFSLFSVIPGLVPGTPLSAAGAGVWRAGAPRRFTVG
jgi:hypothetical protein